MIKPDEHVDGTGPRAHERLSSRTRRQLLSLLMNAGARALVDGAWNKLQAEWQSDDAHKRFIALCAGLDALGEAGRLYRAARERDPTLHDEVERRLNAVMGAAIDQLTRTRTPRRARAKRSMWLMVGACVFFVIHAILTLLRVRSQ